MSKMTEKNCVKCGMRKDDCQVTFDFRKVDRNSALIYKVPCMRKQHKQMP